VAEIDSLITDDFKDDWPVTHAILPHHLHAAMHSFARWFIVMEQIPTQQNKVNLTEKERSTMKNKCQLKEKKHRVHIIQIHASVQRNIYESGLCMNQN